MTISIDRMTTGSGVAVGTIHRECLPREGAFVTVRKDGVVLAQGWFSVPPAVHPSSGHVSPYVVVVIGERGDSVWRGSVTPDMLTADPLKDAPQEWFSTLSRCVHDSSSARVAADSAEARLAEKERWVEGLVDSAHEWADENNLCSNFDDFMESHGLRTRTDEYEVEVRVSATITLSRTARSQSDAESEIDRGDVLEELGRRGVRGVEDLDYEWEIM